MQEYFRAERLTRNISSVIGRDTILPHSPISCSSQRHGSLLQRPALPGNLFCVNVELKEHVRYAELQSMGIGEVCRIQACYVIRHI